MEDRKLIERPRATILAIIGVLLIISLACVSKLQQGQWVIFHSEEIRGSVVDAASGTPVDGAIVVGMWQLTGLLGEGFDGYASIAVVRTDKEGRFAIPSWRGFKPWKCCASIDELAPKIVIYKPGYKVHWSHRIMRMGFPSDISKSWAEKDKALEEYSITPAKLKRVYTDEEIWKSYREFDSESGYHEYYSKKQLKEMMDSLKAAALQLPNRKSANQILNDVNEVQRYWVDGKK